MKPFRPKIFIGSSSEAKQVAVTASEILNDDVIPDIWDMSPYFKPMHGTFDALLSAAKGYDFALFIMSPDDRIESRGEKLASTRDNILFELGLFVGAIGPDRVFAVVQNSAQQDKIVKMPSDLLGLTIPRFKENEIPSSLRNRP
jgi:predicted nucleotide-binding protein